MANTGLVTLGSLRLQAQQRADKVGSNFVTVAEWNQYLSNSYKELYDLLATSYGDEYYVALPYHFVTGPGAVAGSPQLYALPDGLTTIDSSTGLVAPAFYKLLAVDLQLGSSPTSWVTLKGFPFTERNRYTAVNQAPVINGSSFRYRVVGNNLWLAPSPAAGQTLQLWYIPKPINLQATVVCTTTATSTTVLATDTSALAVGMSVSSPAIPGTPVIPLLATISSIIANTSFAISAAANATGSQLLTVWSDQTTLDGVSGWEEYVIVDAAIKANEKEETDVTALMGQKQALMVRIVETCTNRDASLPSRVSDSAATGLSWPGSAGMDGDS